VLEIIRKLRDQGVPVILITHTLPDVFAVADRLIVMHRGRKVTEKTTADTSTQELVQYMVGALDDTKRALRFLAPTEVQGGEFQVLRPRLPHRQPIWTAGLPCSQSSCRH
jgi:ABC-type sugar transport system ATPase subunit